jgi:hypothetical protein
MCCGQKRETAMRETMKKTTLSSNSIATPAPAAAPAVTNSPRSASAAQTGCSSVGVRYLERSPIRVRGPATGREYDFSAANPVRSVDTRDAESLLRTRFFAKTG